MTAPSPVLVRESKGQESEGRLPPVAYCAALTALALLVHGYHPYSVDAAIYVPAIKKLLDPSLYPVHAEFFLSHAHFSLISFLVAASVHATRLPLTYVLLGWQLLTTGMLLMACWQLCQACFDDRRASLTGTALAAAVLAVPVAGTSLLLMDQYFTARSLSTPALLFACAAVLKRKPAAAICWLLIALLVHPLMAFYGGIFLVTLYALQYRRHELLWALPLSIMTLFGGAAWYAARHPASDSYRAALLTRSYLFIARWEWYEIVGLVLPLALVAWFWIARRGSASRNQAICAVAALLNGAFFLVVALILGSTPKLLTLARYQPLRSFHIIYFLLFLLPVNFCLRRLLPNSAGVAAVLLLVCSGMFLVEQYTFPDGHRVEWPWMQPTDPWREAFAWVRDHTPKDAVFALSPDYMSEPREDAVGFRAYAERASLADRCTDGGVVVLFPKLAPVWFAETRDTAGLDRIRFGSATERLRLDGASWIVLPRRPNLGLDCPHVNDEVAVCRLAPGGHLRAGDLQAR
jgi:hypothetical protein